MSQRIILAETDKRADIKVSKLIKRVDEGVNGLMQFGQNNDYPQLMERLINSSVNAKACADIYSRFLTGFGFENEEINNVVVGVDQRGKKITLSKLLNQAAVSVSRFNGFYIHVNLNLDRKVKNAALKPFKYARFAMPDDSGYSAKILFYDNWEKDKDIGRYDPKNKAKSYNVFNLEENVFVEQVKNAGGIEKYKGQVYFSFFDDEFFYPLSKFDSVYLDCDTDNQMSLFKNRQPRNGFFKKTIIRTQPAEGESPEEFAARIKQVLGVDGDGVLVMTDDVNPDNEFGERSGFAVDQLDSGIDDQHFQDWEKILSNKIRKAANNIPAILIDYEQSNLGNTSGEAVREAINFYNLMTEPDRTRLEESFKEIFLNSQNETLRNNTNWKIKPLNYGTNNAVAAE